MHELLFRQTSRSLTATYAVALSTLCLLGSVRSLPCVSPEIQENLDVHVGQCTSYGVHELHTVVKPGNYSCRAYAGRQLMIPESAGAGSCSMPCGAGFKLGLVPNEEEDGPHGPPTKPGCVECPPNTFSVGGGHLVDHWGRLDLRAKEQDDLPILLAPAFTSTCWGFNDTHFQATHETESSWVEGFKCQPWVPDSDGDFLQSGSSREARRVWSELSIRLRFVTAGKMWFKFRVNADNSPQAVDNCPWLKGHTGQHGTFMCEDGTYGNNSYYCNDHGGRAQCPSNFPIMCAQPGICAGNEAYCCSIDCSNFGGPRLCPDTGGLQVLVCNDTRVRRCEEQPLAEPPANPYYSTNQYEWKWVQLHFSPGWKEIRFRYVRQGAVAGDDKAFLEELGWYGTALADTECRACPPGKQSARGSDRCNTCGANTFFHRGTCQPCPADKYAMPGAAACEERPPCTRQDFVKRFTECKTKGDKHVRDKFFEWLEPKVCKGGAQLPEREEDVDCESCGVGRVRRGNECVYCGVGTYSAATDKKCKSCPAGSEAVVKRVYDVWDEWPLGMTTGCFGECGTTGWRLHEGAIDSGTHHLAPASSWVELELNLTRPGAVEFKYDLTCHSDYSTFNIVVNGESYEAAAKCQKNHQMRQNGTQVIALLEGRHSLRWIYTRKQNPTNKNNGHNRRADDDEEEGAMHTRGGGKGGGKGKGGKGGGGGGGGGGSGGGKHGNLGQRFFEGIAKISRVVLHNVEVGGAEECTKCQPGHFSIGPTKACEPCPVGHYSIAPSHGVAGPTKCLPCPPNTFAPVRGTASCRPCGPNSTSPEGSSQCSSNFIFPPLRGHQQGEQYDLSQLSNIVGPIMLPADESAQLAVDTDDEAEPYDQGLFLSLDQVMVSKATGRMSPGPPSAAVPLQCIGAYACIAPVAEGVRAPTHATSEYAAPPDFGSEGFRAMTHNVGSSRGFEDLPEFLKAYRALSSYDSSGILWRAGGGFTVVMSDGAPCKAGARWETRLYMVCDKSKVESEPQYLTICGDAMCKEIAGECVRHVLWESALGCPLCTSSSFVELGTACVRGVRNVSYEYAQECSGGMALPADASNVRCTVDIGELFTTADKVAMGFMGILAIIVIFILAERALLYKRLYSRYKTMQLNAGRSRAAPQNDDL